MDRDATRFLHETVPFSQLLGLEVLESSPDVVRVRAEWQPDHCGAGGVLNGGFLMSLADITGAACGFLNMPEGASATTTLESKTNLMRPVSGGAVTAVSRAIHVGRSTIVIETDVFDDAGRRAARTLQTQSVLRP